VRRADAVIPSAIPSEQLALLQQWVADIEAWPAGSHVWGHYAEQTTAGPAICRTENVSACHAGVAALVDRPLAALAAVAVGEPVVAFKDKINYKQPGGAGFSPHQDRLAYPGVERVLSILLAIDDCNTESGCLWLAPGVTEILSVDDRGVVRGDVAADLDWRSIELTPGDAVYIDGLAPHYSDANRSSSPRRVLVASYAPRREQYSREEYYAARLHGMDDATARDGRFRISTLADFEGTEVVSSRSVVDRCTHA
jgi:Phytanoyl-CoA dioxygenase (PhyH)